MKKFCKKTKKRIVAVIGFMGLLFLTNSSKANNNTSSAGGVTRGERNNNLGNIKYNSGINWSGQIGKDADGFVIFSSIYYGLRALKINLVNQKSLHGLNTIDSIMNKYTSGDSALIVSNYKTFIKNRTGVTSIHTPLNLSSNKSLLEKFIGAIVDFENEPTNNLSIKYRSTIKNVVYS